MSTTTGTGRVASSATLTDAVNPATVKFDGWTLRTSAVDSVIGGCVVVEVDPVRRTHLAQPSPGRRQQVRDAEAVADLDQLSPGHDDLSLPGERMRHEGQRGGAVVDDEHVLRVGYGASQCRERRSAAAVTRARW